MAQPESEKPQQGQGEPEPESETPTRPTQSSTGEQTEELLKRAQDGDEDALRELFESQFGLVARIARRYMRDPVDAEDVVSEVFVRLLRLGAPPLGTSGSGVG